MSERYKLPLIEIKPKQAHEQLALSKKIAISRRFQIAEAAFNPNEPEAARGQAREIFNDLILLDQIGLTEDKDFRDRIRKIGQAGFIKDAHTYFLEKADEDGDALEVKRLLRLGAVFDYDSATRIQRFGNWGFPEHSRLKFKLGPFEKKEDWTAVVAAKEVVAQRYEQLFQKYEQAPAIYARGAQTPGTVEINQPEDFEKEVKAKLEQATTDSLELSLPAETLELFLGETILPGALPDTGKLIGTVVNFESDQMKITAYISYANKHPVITAIFRNIDDPAVGKKLKFDKKQVAGLTFAELYDGREDMDTIEANLSSMSEVILEKIQAFFGPGWGAKRVFINPTTGLIVEGEKTEWGKAQALISEEWNKVVGTNPLLEKISDESPEAVFARYSAAMDCLHKIFLNPQVTPDSIKGWVMVEFLIPKIFGNGQNGLVWLTDNLLSLIEPVPVSINELPEILKNTFIPKSLRGVDVLDESAKEAVKKIYRCLEKATNSAFFTDPNVTAALNSTKEVWNHSINFTFTKYLQDLTT